MKFFDTLFDPLECTCYTPLYGTAIAPAHVGDDPDTIEYFQSICGGIPEFFSINPIRSGEKRCDDAVTAYRNILVEMDTIPPEEQRALLDRSGLPYSTLVFSGGKSLHAIISLQTPLASKAEYVFLAKRIYQALDKIAGKKVCDAVVCNPSRLSRYPGVVRQSSGKLQELLVEGDRVPTVDVIAWVDRHIGKFEFQPQPPRLPRIPVPATVREIMLSISAKRFLAKGAPQGEWNITLFKTACEMTRLGFSEEEIMERCEGITGHLDDRDLATIESAVRSES